jgi:hypothetical protein
MFSNRVICSGILATLIYVGCNSRKSAHLIYPFLNSYLVLGGDLDLKAKNLPKGGLMIPFAILTSWFPYGLALAPFGRKVAGQSSSQISRATLHNYL